MAKPAEPTTASLWEEFDEVDIADVVVDIEAPDLQPSYSYRVPEALRNTLFPGACVHLPFAGREVLGYVLERRKMPLSDPLIPRLKEIISIVEEPISINTEQLHIARWITETYVCDLLSAVRCVAPASLGSRVIVMARLRDRELRGMDVGNSLPQAHIVETLHTLNGEAEVETLKETANLANFQSAYSALLKKGVIIETREVSRPRTVFKTAKGYTRGAVADTLGERRLTERQQKVLDVLSMWSRERTDPMPAEMLLKTSGETTAVLKGLENKGLILPTEIKVRRAPVSSPDKRTSAPALSDGQVRATETLGSCIAQCDYIPVLLFGVTASGKTEVYLNAIEQAIAQGRTAMVLLPEIALTAQVVDVFVGRFGDRVAVLHSRLSEGERHDEWRRMQEGQARIVVGARSAVFAPLENLGLIVVDEEHEASYKQEKTPRYNARTLALERGRLCKATVVLGSATPSLESYYLSYQPNLPPKRAVEDFLEVRQTHLEERYLRIEMRERIDNRPLPKVRVIDLREEFKQRRALFSTALIAAMEDRLARKQQTILFLNRRGYAQFVLCRDCGYVARCPHCAVSLSFHLYDRALHCHHCEFVGRAPSICPECKSMKIKAFGLGTEKVEEEVLRLFPEAKVARMDRDTTANKGAHTRIVREFRSGEAEILIGTQMVAKGLDFPNVTLVGVVSADTAINMPDFRAAERTFQLLTQVAGRAGRGKNLGEVIIQTFTPEHYAVEAAINHDYEAFYRQEILFRKELRYPPFSRFVNLICAHHDQRRAEHVAEALTHALKEVVGKGVEVIGPAEAPLARLKNLYRYHVALRANLDAPLSQIVRSALERLLPAERMSIAIDMDPLSMA
jgi:primosomal protein N' (replication factor Y)